MVKESIGGQIKGALKGSVTRATTKSLYGDNSFTIIKRSFNMIPFLSLSAQRSNLRMTEIREIREIIY